MGNALSLRIQVTAIGISFLVSMAAIAQPAISPPVVLPPNAPPIPIPGFTRTDPRLPIATGLALAPGAVWKPTTNPNLPVAQGLPFLALPTGSSALPIAVGTQPPSGFPKPPDLSKIPIATGQALAPGAAWKPTTNPNLPVASGFPLPPGGGGP